MNSQHEWSIRNYWEKQWKYSQQTAGLPHAMEKNSEQAGGIGSIIPVDLPFVSLLGMDSQHEGSIRYYWEKQRRYSQHDGYNRSYASFTCQNDGRLSSIC